MSIIHEALKKTQDSLRETQAKDVPLPESTIKQASQVPAHSTEVQTSSQAQSRVQTQSSSQGQVRAHSQSSSTAPVHARPSGQVHSHAQTYQKAQAPKPHVPLKESEVKAKPSMRIPKSPYVSEPRVANNNFPWKVAGLCSFAGLLLVASLGAPSVFHYHPNFKMFSSLAKKPSPGPELADNKERPIVTAPTNLVLTGTMLEGQHRLAVINHQTYQVGDQIDEKK